MIKNILSLCFFICLAITVNGQNSNKAIKVSQKALELVKSKKSNDLIQLFETEVLPVLNEEEMNKFIDQSLKTINNEPIDFKNYKTDLIKSDQDNTKEFYRFRFPLGSKGDGKDFFQVTFLAAGNYEKVYSLNFIRIERMKDVTVTFGAENEKIPGVGEVKTELYSDTGFIKTIKYRDFQYFIIIEFDEHQNKVSESKFPLDNLTFKTLTQFYPNGKIELIATYENGFITGHFQKFYENGNLEREGFYIKKLKKEGYWKYFSENGSLDKIEQYVDGKKM